MLQIYTLEPGSHLWSPPSLDCIQGSLYGLALGDALGGPHEPYQSKYTYTGIIEHPIKRHTQWQGTKISAIGQVTDDTEMTITLAKVLISNNGYNRDAAIFAYETWASQPRTMLGYTTGALFSGITTKVPSKGVKTYETRYKKALAGNLKKLPRKNLVDVQSNGSLMRCSPFIVIPGYESITVDTNLTNPNPINLDVNYLYVSSLQQLSLISNTVDSISKVQELYNWLQASAQTSSVRQLFLDIEQNIPRDITGKDKGWVLHAFWCCLFSLRMLISGSSFKNILDTIILMGGDTDTNGAIVGAMIGSYFGYETMVSDPTTEYNIKKIKSITSDVTATGDWPRDSAYTADNLDNIAQGLYNLGLSFI